MENFFVRAIALCLMLAPVIGSAQALKVGITLVKDVELNRWVINYEFSEAIDAVKFDNTPYSFVESDWKIKTAGATFDYSLLQARLGIPGKHLSIALESENDHFVRGFYTPFLNFSDGGRAIFVGHYVPSEVKASNSWISIHSAEISLTVSIPQTEKILFGAKHKVDKLTVSADDARQYVYVGRLPVKKYDNFNLLMDPALPAWAQESLLAAIPQFYDYFESKTQAGLNFMPLFIINYKAGPGQTLLDGGAISRQVAINFVGDGRNQNPENDLFRVLSLLAHEMAHLWNSQHWRNEDENSVWMHEGGAEYFSRKALLNFGYISAEEDARYYKSQAKKCIEVLNKGAINDLRNRSDKYICGEVIYKLSALMTNNEVHLNVWNNLMTSRDSLAYSEQMFIQALYTASTNRNEAATIENALRKGSADEFEALIEKYIGQIAHSNSILPDIAATTD